MNEKHLRIYLQDHLAGSTAGLELARRTRGANEGTEYGPPLAKIADEIEADRRALQAIMEDFGFGGDKLKNMGAWSRREGRPAEAERPAHRLLAAQPPGRAGGAR